MYRKILGSAFTVPWGSDDDAMYVISECRRLFRQNERLTDLAEIERKVREAEMRYAIGVHYRIPYPRMFYKAQGSIQQSGVPYSPYLDSLYDTPYSTRPEEGGSSAVAFPQSAVASYESFSMEERMDNDVEISAKQRGGSSSGLQL